jgi:syntaxin 16
LLKESEKELRRLGHQESESKSDEQIKINIMRHLAEKMKDLTIDFKNNEKEHYVKIKEFHGDDDVHTKQKKLDDEFFLCEMQKQEEAHGAKYKDEEITNLVKSINDLAGIFKDLSVLVVEQGTILDRIDHNIESAKEHTEKATEILEKVHSKEKSPRA